MKSLEQIEDDADCIALSSNTNYSHGERKLAAMVSDLTNHLADALSVIDDLVRDHLDEAGIDMRPAYARLREMIDERTNPERTLGNTDLHETPRATTSPRENATENAGTSPNDAGTEGACFNLSETQAAETVAPNPQNDKDLPANSVGIEGVSERVLGHADPLPTPATARKAGGEA